MGRRFLTGLSRRTLCQTYPFVLSRPNNSRGGIVPGMTILKTPNLDARAALVLSLISSSCAPSVHSSEHRSRCCSFTRAYHRFCISLTAQQITVRPRGIESLCMLVYIVSGLDSDPCICTWHSKMLGLQSGVGEMDVARSLSPRTCFHTASYLTPSI
jgi:hypothetical protein